ncbi:MAG TPA: hypothetical protein VLG46_16145, partial [Anaerolineae bacterium]|nr:hypothetical protein [Anaerolineae bacterium]
MNYTGLFSRAWSLTWRYPSMALVVLMGTLLNLLLSFVLSPVLSPFGLVAAGSSYLVIIIQGAVGLAITAFTAGALISMVNSIEDGQPVSIGFGVQSGLSRLVPLFFVTLALQIPVWLVAFLQARSLVDVFASMGQSGFANPNLPLSYFILNLLITLLVGAIGVGAERAIVLEKQAVFAALKTGWNLLWRKLKDFVVIALIFLLFIILLFVISICASSIFIRTATVSILSGMQTGISSLTSMFTSPVMAFFFVVSLLFGIFAAVFVSSVW